jgi:ApaG protein
MTESDTVTQGIRIVARSYYIAERSDPKQGQFYFAYKIQITNEGDAPAQLVSRHWIITDGNGQVEHVQGEGVVGEQPRLEPGQMFEYVSACPLGTPVGSMRGTYQMVRDDGSGFDAAIGAFTHSTPDLLN